MALQKKYEIWNKTRVPQAYSLSNDLKCEMIEHKIKWFAFFQIGIYLVSDTAIHNKALDHRDNRTYHLNCCFVKVFVKCCVW